MKYGIILFDADGTLFDFKKCERSALQLALSELSLPNGDTYIERYSEINELMWKRLERGEIEKSRLAVERFEVFLRELSLHGDAARLSELYKARLSEQAYLIEGAESVLSELSAEHRLFIITNGIKSVQEGRMSRSPIKKYFEKVFISEELGFEKPRREFFDKVASGISGFSADNAIVIGDSLTSDIQGGINAGIDTCWYNPQGNGKPEGMNITYTVGDLKEILPIV